MRKNAGEEEQETENGTEKTPLIYSEGFCLDFPEDGIKTESGKTIFPSMPDAEFFATIQKVAPEKDKKTPPKGKIESDILFDRK